MSDETPTAFVVDCATGAAVERPMDADELAQQQADAAVAAAAYVEDARARAAAAIHHALLCSDVWAARHVEDGVSLTPERIAYRQQLRALLAQTLDDQTDPATIALPDPPPFAPIPDPTPIP